MRRHSKRTRPENSARHGAMAARHWVALLALLLCVAGTGPTRGAAAASSIAYYVDAGAPNGGNGLSPATPFNNLTQAFAQTAAAFGAYSATTLYLSGQFALTNPDGGFYLVSPSSTTRTLTFAQQPGTAAKPSIDCAGAAVDVFNITRNDGGPTVFSGLIVANCQVAIVIQQTNAQTTLDVDAVEIYNCTSPLPHAQWAGAAILSYSASYSLTNSVFDGNSGPWGAVSMQWAASGVPRVVRNCTFLRNYGSGLDGSVGALFVLTADVSDCYFAYNHIAWPDDYYYYAPVNNATIGGSGIRVGGYFGAIPATITDCVFEFNEAPAVELNDPYYQSPYATPLVLSGSQLRFNEWGLSCNQGYSITLDAGTLVYHNQMNLACVSCGGVWYGTENLCLSPCAASNRWDRCYVCGGDNSSCLSAEHIGAVVHTEARGDAPWQQPPHGAASPPDEPLALFTLSQTVCRLALAIALLAFALLLLVAAVRGQKKE